jgi:transposase-like protein
MANKKTKKKSEMDLLGLMDKFHSEERCAKYLEELRWPTGIECPRCGGTTISRILKRAQFDCDSCRYQFSVKVDTIFHDSKLPLRKWFAAVYLMCESKKGISANQIGRTLKVSYKTAWYLCHRIRATMVEHDTTPLEGVIECDETLVGGRAPGKGKGYKGNKTTVLGAVERDGNIRLKVATNRSRKTLHKFIKKNADMQDVDAVYTDSFAAYEGVTGYDGRHSAVNHEKEEWVRGQVHTNTIEGAFSLFKRSIVGAFHQVSVKHLPAYLDEFEFRYDNRDNPYLFRDTVLKLIAAKRLEYKELTA